MDAVIGGVAERLKALVLKTSEACKRPVGSNPTPSASRIYGLVPIKIKTTPKKMVASLAG